MFTFVLLSKGYNNFKIINVLFCIEKDGTKPISNLTLPSKSVAHSHKCVRTAVVSNFNRKQSILTFVFVGIHISFSEQTKQFIIYRWLFLE